MRTKPWVPSDASSDAGGQTPCAAMAHPRAPHSRDCSGPVAVDASPSGESRQSDLAILSLQSGPAHCIVTCFGEIINPPTPPSRARVLRSAGCYQNVGTQDE